METVSQIRMLICCFLAGATIEHAEVSATPIASNECSGIWAASGETPFIAPNAALRDIFAPNGMVSIKATGEGLTVVGRKQSTHLENVIGNPPVTEVLWSPDSRHFVVNESDGGVVGTWTTHFYTLDKSEHLISRDIASFIKPLANKMSKCESAEEANIGTVAWLNGGKELLLVAEVPPHSSCRNMGEVAGFRVSIESWKVIERLSENKLRKKWVSVLGCRFANGNDPLGHRSNYVKKPIE